MASLATPQYVLGINSKQNDGHGMQKYDKAEQARIFAKYDGPKKELIHKAAFGHSPNKQNQGAEAESQGQNSTNAILTVPYKAFLPLGSHSTRNRATVLNIPFSCRFE